MRINKAQLPMKLREIEVCNDSAMGGPNSGSNGSGCAHEN
jgi:hypothetical protein